MKLEQVSIPEDMIDGKQFLKRRTGSGDPFSCTIQKDLYCANFQPYRALMIETEPGVKRKYCYKYLQRMLP